MYLHGLCRLGRDADLRYLPDGTPVLGMALAYNHGKKDEKGNRAAQWVDASLFGERAKAIADVAQTVINTAKVEIDYLKAAGDANARLIAAAPALLAVCEGLLESTAYWGPIGIVDKLTAAVEQARGKRPEQKDEARP